MTSHLDRALAPLLRDLEAAEAPLPRVEPAAWQDRPTAESAYLWAEDGSGTGIWVDTAEPPAEQLVMLADQVQDWAVEELWGQRRSTNWPVCEEHPFTHPLEPAEISGVAVWRCPTTQRPICEIGLLRGADTVPMSVVSDADRSPR